MICLLLKRPSKSQIKYPCGEKNDEDLYMRVGIFKPEEIEKIKNTESEVFSGAPAPVF